MPPYAPTSRRPIASLFRATAQHAVGRCVRWHIHPDAISYGSIVAAGGAGIGYWNARTHPMLLLAAPLLCFLRLWCNMLDGMVALASGQASPRGEIVNDLPDRVSDVLIFAGVAHSGLASVAGGYWAAILALMTAYVGTLGQAAGARREFGGVMSKPWRMVWLAAGSGVTFALLQCHRSITFGGWTVLDWTCVLIIAGCVQTAWVRLWRIFRTLREREKMQNAE